jgi:hypothetical protein
MCFEQETGDNSKYERTEIEFLEEQLKVILERLDHIVECKVAAVHVDEAINSLSKIKSR